jgi:hypothetical protein
VIDAGFVQLRQAIRSGSRVGVAARTLRLAGTAIGFIFGLLHPIREGHFGKPSRAVQGASRPAPR